MTRTPRHPRRRGRAVLAWVALVAVGAAFGATLAPPAPPAATAADADSSVTVKWAGENDPALQQYQVDHRRLLTDASGADAGTGHWDDFRNLSITVSKTQGLRDEAVVVTATGMPTTAFPAGDDKLPSSYLQLMQCWGPDPLAAGFAETCQFGAWSPNTGDDAASAAMGKAVRAVGVATRGPDPDTQVPFRTVVDTKSTPTKVNPRGGSSSVTIDGTAQFFGSANSNEQPIVYMNADGARTAFTVQTAGTQPYLGCGTPTRTRCWLVVVPRGAHSGERDAPPPAPGAEPPPLACVAGVYGGKPKGERTFAQVGSPVDPRCSFFDNRIVVPLDFAPPSSGCAPGAPESRLVGSELLADAMSSWQRGLCATAGTAYNLTTSSGTVTRDQLLAGSAPVAVVANPLAAGTVSEGSEPLLADARVRYAPVANAALTISFVMTVLRVVGEKPPEVVVWRDVRLTPRLIAKALTQSYGTDVPHRDGAYRNDVLPGRAIFLAGGGVNTSDPEWVALGNPQPPGVRGQFVVSGPQGEDAVELLWRYLQADADAAAFLRGEPDPWGARINPYYLPAGHPDAKGEGLPVDLSTQPLDTVPKADGTLAPKVETEADATELRERYRGQRFDSVAMLPYSGSLGANAARIARTDTKYTNTWDSAKEVGNGPTGAWVPDPPMIGGNRYTIGPTDAASAARYALDSAALPPPLATRTGKDDVRTARTWVAPSVASMSSAARTLTSTDPTRLPQVDPRALPSDAYPLTVPLYAAVNVADAGLDSAARGRIADLLAYISTKGNRVGAAPGELPEGFAPLTAAQLAQTADARGRILSEYPSAEVPPGSPAPPLSAAPAAVVPVAAPGGVPPAAATTTAAAPVAAASTSAAVGAPPALGGALLVGAAGLVAAPFLLRRRSLSG